MPYRVVKYQETPNPNAVKIYLDPRVAGTIRSYLRPPSAEQAAADPLAAALFALPGVVNVLINGDWLTVSKRPDIPWGGLKAAVERVLAADTAPAPASGVPQ